MQPEGFYILRRDISTKDFAALKRGIIGQDGGLSLPIDALRYMKPLLQVPPEPEPIAPEE